MRSAISQVRGMTGGGRNKRRRWLFAAVAGGLAAALALLASGGETKQGTQERESPLVRTMTVGGGAGDRASLFSGEVKGRVETQLAFQVGGKILRRHVEVGSFVRAGEILMQIDPRDIRQSVASGEANHAAALSQFNLAKTNYERSKRLFEQNVISRAEYERVENAYNGATAQLRAAQAQFDQVSNQLGYSYLRADRSGVVTALQAEEGQVVGAGQRVATLVQSGEKEVEINVAENRIAEVRAWRGIQVRFWALPGVTVAGRIREVSPMADAQSRTFRVRVALIGPPEDVALGMSATISVAGSGGQREIAIPLSAIIQTGDVPFVWCVQNGAVSLRRISVGEFREAGVTVLSGLSEGEVIVTAGVHKLRAGQSVRLVNEGGRDEKL